ncbi:hypothetical protein Pmar_PMAR005225, partial [Perkinsus marinus ATCC 50983]
LCEVDELDRSVPQDTSARRNIVSALRFLAGSIHADLKMMWESPFSRLKELED